MLQYAKFLLESEIRSVPSCSASKPFIPFKGDSQSNYYLKSTGVLKTALEHDDVIKKLYEKAKGLILLCGEYSNLTILDIDIKDKSLSPVEVINEAFSLDIKHLNEVCKYAVQTQSGSVQLFYTWEKALIYQIGVLSSESRFSIDILSSNKDRGYTNSFACEQNSGYVKLFGEVYQRGAIPENMLSRLNLINARQKLQYHSFGKELQEIELKYLKNPLHNILSAYLEGELTKTALRQNLPLLRGAQQGNRHDTLKKLCVKLALDPSVDLAIGEEFLKDCAYNMIMFTERDHAEVTSLIDKCFLNFKDFVYMDDWRVHTEKLKNLNREIEWFYEPESDVYYRWDSSKPLVKNGPNATLISLTPGAAISLFGKENPGVKNVKKELLSCCKLVTAVFEPENNFFIAEVDHPVASFKINFFEPSPYLSEFRNPNLVKEKHLSSLWEIYFDNITGKKRAVKHYLFNWLASLLRKPSASKVAIGLRGVAGGEGKSLFFQILAKLFGENNCVLNTNPEDLLSKFNLTLFKHKLFVFIEEFENLGSSQHSFIRICKQVVGAPFLSGEQKFARQSSGIANYVSLLVASNSAEPIFAGRDQKTAWRKFVEFETTHINLNKFLKDTQIEWLLSREGLLELLKYLKGYPVDDALFQKPLHTKEYTELVTANMSAENAAVQILLDPHLGVDEKVEKLKDLVGGEFQQEVEEWKSRTHATSLSNVDGEKMFGTYLWGKVKRLLALRGVKATFNVTIVIKRDVKGNPAELKQVYSRVLSDIAYKEFRELLKGVRYGRGAGQERFDRA